MPNQKVKQAASSELSQVVRRHLRGDSPTEIARQLDLTVPQVSRHLALARRRWTECALARKSLVAQLLEDLDQIETSFETEWNRLGPRLPQSKKGKVLAGRVPYVEDSDPDHVRLLESAAACIAGRVRLTPMDSAPTCVAATGEPLDDLSAEEVDSELVRLAYGAQLKRTQTST